MKIPYYKAAIIVLGIALIFTLYGAFLNALLSIAQSPSEADGSFSHKFVRIIAALFGSEKLTTVASIAFLFFLILTSIYVIISLRLVKDYIQKRFTNKLQHDILDNLLEGVIIFRSDGTVVFTNRAVQQFLKIPPITTGDTQYADLFGHNHEISNLIAGCINTHKSINGREIRLQIDSSERLLLMSVFALPDSGVLPSKYCVFLWDNTELSRLQRSVNTRDRLALLGRLTSNISHEIRNPLSALDVNLQLLREKLDGMLDEARFHRIAKYFEIIQSELKRLNGHINSLLQFASRPKLNLEWVRIYDFVSAILEFIQPRANELHIEIIVRLAPALPEVYCDRNAIKQVFLNLINNAFAAMPGGGKLFIEIIHNITTDMIEISVIDSGSGIPEENMDKIFELYFTTKEEGSGIGLSIALYLVEEHGGVITVENVKGKGAKFRVELPVAGPWRSKKTTKSGSLSAENIDKGENPDA